MKKKPCYNIGYLKRSGFISRRHGVGSIINRYAEGVLKMGILRKKI